MNERNAMENRIALIGLTVLTVITLAVFAFCFLGAGDLFSGNGGGTEVSEPSDSTDGTQTTDREQISSVIAECQTKMNNFQTQLDSPYLLLVNESNPLPVDYEVGELTLLDGYKTLKLETTAAERFNEFLVAAKKAGYAASLTAAYRTEKQQKTVYDDAVEGFMNAGYPAETARSMAAVSVGSVNCSEHQLGFSVDFSKKEMSLLGADGRSFEEYLNDTIYQYGFILSYPAGEEDQTGREANTVHYRYVGVAAAEEMKKEGWTLNEYRDYLQTQLNYLKQYVQSLESK
ncbi:MAG: M15 family metallopeptidase [Clostridia bacterium]|nr:M15 family metallopeptidase [Clostridia bacterium]